MAGFLRPRRGRRSTAESQAIILKRGEVFFECPDTGVGTGTGKIKVGDGTTAYADLPYFMDLSSVTTDVAGSAIAFTESTTTDNATLLASIKSGATLKTMISAMKKLLSNLDTSVTQLNNDLESYATTDEVTNIVNNAIESGEIIVSSSVIRKITRGTSSVNGSKTISCTITDTSKVLVILDVNGCIDQYRDSSYTYMAAAAPGVYLTAVSTTGITVKGFGFYVSGYNEFDNTTIAFSYQIIEFM